MPIDWGKGWGSRAAGTGTPGGALGQAAAQTNPSIAAGVQKAFATAEAIRNDPNSPENVRNQIEETARRNAEEAVARHEAIKALVTMKSEEIRNNAQMNMSQKLMALGELQDRQSQHYSMTMAKVRNGTRGSDPVVARMNQFTGDLQKLGFDQQAREAEQRAMKSEYNIRARNLGLDDPRLRDPSFNLTDKDRWAVGQRAVDKLLGETRHDLDIATSTATNMKVQSLKDKFTEVSKGIPDSGVSGALGQGMNFLGKVMEPLNLPKEWLFEHPYYSAQLAANRGGNWIDAAASFGAALPGGTFLSEALNGDGGQSFAGSNAYYTSSPERREELVKGGQLESIGTLASKSPFLTRALQFGGGGIGFFLGMDLANQLDANPNAIPQVKVPAFLGLNHNKGYSINSSGFYDAFAQVAGDPLTYTPAILGKAGKVSELSALGARISAATEASEGLGKARAVINPARALEAAGLSVDEVSAISRGGRQAFLGTHVGKGIEAAGTKALANFDDAGRLSKALDIPMNVASEAISVRNAKGLKAGAEVISEAFAAGRFSPSITLRRQALSFLPGVGEGAVGARGVPFVLGNKALRTNERMVYQTLSYLGRGDGAGLARRAGEGVTALDHVVERGNRFVHEGIWNDNTRRVGEAKAGTFSDYWSRHISSDVRGLTAEERFARLGEHKSAVFKAEVDAQFKALGGVGPLDLNSRQDVEQLLRKLEYTAALVDGKAGASAKRMAIAELQLNTPHAETWKGIMGMATDSLGMNRRATLAEAELTRVEAQIPKAQARVAEAERMIAAIQESAPENLEGLKQYSQELKAAKKELKDLKAEGKRWEVAANPFRAPDVTDPGLRFEAPRTRAAIQKDLKQLDKELPKAVSDLKAGLAFARDDAVATARTHLNDVESALKLNEKKQDALSQAARRRGGMDKAMSARKLELRDEHRALETLQKDLSHEVRGLKRGDIATPEMSDAAAQLRVLVDPKDNARELRITEAGIADLDQQLADVVKSRRMALDDLPMPREVTEGDALKAGQKAYTAKLDTQLRELRDTLDTLTAERDVIANSSTSATARKGAAKVQLAAGRREDIAKDLIHAQAVEKKLATERRVMERILSETPDLTPEARQYVERLMEIADREERLLLQRRTLLERQWSLNGGEARKWGGAADHLLRPTPMADYERVRFKDRWVFTTSADIDKFERMTTDQLRREQLRAEQQLERFRLNDVGSPAFDKETGYAGLADPTTGEVTRPMPKARDFYTEDVMVAARNFELATEMLSRVGDRSHPLLAKRTDLLAELADQGHAAGEAASEAISRNIDIRTQEALRSVGVAGTSKMPNTEANRRFMAIRIANIQDPALREAAEKELARLGTKGEGKSLRAFGAQVETAIRDQEFAAMAGDYARQAKEIGDQTVKTYKSAPLGGIFKPFSEPILSILEPVPPTHVRFHSGGGNPLMEMRNRAEDLERVATSLHFDQATVDAFVKAGVEAKKEQDIYDLLSEMYATYAEAHGVDPNALVAAYKRHAAPPERVFSVENPVTKKAKFSDKEKLLSADLVTKPQVASQLINDIPVMDPGEVRNLVRQAKAAEGNLPAKARLALGVVPNVGLPLTGGKLVVKDVFKKTHKFWKFSVVTNAPFALVLGGLGFATGDDMQDRWGRALKFGAVGALGSVRYLGRVVGVEERLVRYSAVRGLNPLEWIPVIAKAQRRVGVDLPFRLVDDIASTSHPLAHFEGRNLVTVGEDWIALGQTDARYVDGLWRVVNHHINPETDDLARMTLQGQLGIIGDETTPWESLAKEWLKTEDGQLLLERMKFAPDGPTSADELIANYSKFIDGYLPTEDMKRLRLANADLPNATIDHDALKSMLKEDPANLPKAVYAQDSWYVPKPWKQQQMSTTLNQVFGRNVLENPTAKMNRIPLAEQIYQEEYRSLVLNGVGKEEARNIAEVRAVDRTNKVMFRISDESRFAAKADFLFPFQQPREELARVYFRMVMDNKAHVMQMGEIGAKVFNDGKESGMFYQGTDKEWRMRVPGSAYLSELFGAPQDAFEFRVRDAFFFLQGSASYGAGFDPQNSTGDLLQTVIPTPGGPFWTMAYKYAFEHMPGLQDKLKENGWLYDRLFPFGDSGFLTSALARHGFAAVTGGGVAPWEIANREGAENEIKKYQDLLIRVRQDENLKAGGPKDYFPPEELVIKDMETFFTLWAMMNAVVPAAARPVFAGKEDFDRLELTYRNKYGKDAYTRLYQDHPEASAIWLPGNQVWRDGQSQDFLDWNDEANGKPWEYDGTANNQRRYLTYDELFHVWADRKRVTSIWTEFYEIQNGYYDSPAEKMLAIEKFKQKAEKENPDFDFNTNYEKVKWLNFILTQADKSQQGSLLNTWRNAYGVTPREYAELKQKALAFEASPWIEARTVDEVRDLVTNAKLNVLNGGDERAWVKQNLSPAEQVKYWQSKMLDMSYYHGGFDSTKYKSALGDALAGPEEGYAGDALEEYRFYKSQMSQVYTDNPDAFRSKKSPSYYNMVTKAIQDKYYENLSASYKEIDDLTKAKQAAYDGKRWSEYQALRGRVNDAYARQRALLDNLHNKVADLSVISEYKDDLLAMMLPTPPEMKEWQKQKVMEHAQQRYAELGMNGLFIAFGSEAEYQKMTPVIQRAYLDDLLEKLNSKPGDYEGEIHSIRWSYLNEWQKELLRAVMPKETVDAWIAKDEHWAELTAKPKKGYSKKKYTKWRKSYRSNDPAQSALGYAYSLMKQYSKRLPGEKAPAAYAEYIALPKDPATRHAFLRAHPEVSDWIRRGPLANMPSLERALVSDIMIQYGKWEGEDLDSGAVLELAFAHEQMKKYSLRGDDIAPEAYDLWMAMPSGQEKADYIKSHPEIGEWLRRGPMANMPEEMKSIVRDIMFKYGEWQQNSDPLGELISEMNSMPSYARPQFMREHPELAEYFSASKSPQERAMADTMNAYFSLQDAGARAMYLSAHPELKDYFVTARNRNYEKFLNRVAIYMGANPTMFENYLKRQQDTMTELIQRFGQTPFVREVKAGKSEKKSKRASARQM